MKTTGVHITWAVCILFSSALSAAQTSPSDADMEKMSQIEEVMRKMDASISFYGIVVDQDGAPVAQADVQYHIIHFSPDMESLFGAVKKGTSRTDDNGLFSIQGERGRSIYIQGISKAGYEFILSENRDQQYVYFENGNTKPFVPDRSKPVLFRLRRRGAQSFLLHRLDVHIQITVAESGRTRGYDLVRNASIRDLGHPVLNGEALNSDIEMTATFNSKDGTWDIIVRPGGVGGGIVASERLLYEAPEDGYVTQWRATPRMIEWSKPVCLYLRTRQPAIYTRIELREIAGNKDFARISGEAYTNPYGERVLDGPPDIPFDLQKQLDDDVKRAFQQNKRAPSVNILELLGNSRQSTK